MWGEDLKGGALYKSRSSYIDFDYLYIDYLWERYTVKFFFQSISWNTVSGSFHETWNTFMKYFYFSIQHSLRMFLTNEKIVFAEKRYRVKKTPSQVFSCEIWGILKNTYFEEHLNDYFCVLITSHKLIFTTSTVDIFDFYK